MVLKKRKEVRDQLFPIVNTLSRGSVTAVTKTGQKLNYLLVLVVGNCLVKIAYKSIRKDIILFVRKSLTTAPFVTKSRNLLSITK